MLRETSARLLKTVTLGFLFKRSSSLTEFFLREDLRTAKVFLYLWLLFCLFSPSQLCSEEKRSPAKSPVCHHNRKECQLINRWYLERTASGHRGDCYDNRDRGHSGLKLSHYPQLRMTTYSPEELAKKNDWAGQYKILPYVTIGNSSTSASATGKGSNTRSFY